MAANVKNTVLNNSKENIDIIFASITFPDGAGDYVFTSKLTNTILKKISDFPTINFKITQPWLLAPKRAITTRRWLSEDLILRVVLLNHFGGTVTDQPARFLIFQT